MPPSCDYQEIAAGQPLEPFTAGEVAHHCNLCQREIQQGETIFKTTQLNSHLHHVCYECGMACVREFAELYPGPGPNPGPFANQPNPF